MSKGKGHDNLIPFDQRTEEEQRAIRQKGGKASVESRRRRKTLKEELLALLSDGDVQKSVATALINEAINGNNAGSVTRAFEVLRDTIGESPDSKQDVIAEAKTVILVPKEKLTPPENDDE